MFSKQLFGERVLTIRKTKGETQSELAAILGVNKSTICEMEQGKKATTAEKISLICLHYHISADYLLGLTDDPEPYRREEKE